MENKKDLVKIALAALILSSATPVNGQADSGEAQGIFLAAGCAAHGCPAVNSNKSSDTNANNSGNFNQSGNGYNSHSGGARNQNAPSGNGYRGYTASPNDQGANNSPNGFREPPKGYNHPSGSDNRSANPPSTGGSDRNNSSSISYAYSPPSSYNTQQSGITSPTYVEDYRGVTYDSTPRPTPEYGGLTNFNREYLTTTDYDFNRAAVTTSNSTATFTEPQLLGMLSSQGRAIYLSLDPEGKALAIQLASQDSYKDKNLAVKEAQRRMSERRGLLNR